MREVLYLYCRSVCVNADVCVDVFETGNCQVVNGFSVFSLLKLEQAR